MLKYLSTLLLFLLSTALYAESDTSDFIKVTPSTNAKCVEYYRYQDELYCTTTAKSKQGIDLSLKDKENLNIPFDERPWQMAWGKSTSEFTSIEYVPKGDDINNWNELVTSQFFPGLQNNISIKDFMNTTINHLNESGYQAITKVISETPNQVVFEFRIEAPQNQRQDELQMLTWDDKGIYLLHYVIKKSDMGQANRNKWVKILQASKINPLH